MSSRASAGISQRVSSIRTGSDIEHDVPAPAVAVPVQLEVVVGDGLDEMARLARAPDDDGGHRVLADDEVARLVGHEALGLGEEHELGQPLGEQRAAVGRLDLDAAARRGRRLPVPSSSSSSSRSASTAWRKIAASLRACSSSCSSAVCSIQR